MRVLECSHEEHAGAILDILNEAIVNSTALYDYVPRPFECMAPWFETKRQANFPVLGAVNTAGTLLGFASYGTFRAWPAYKYSVEHSVYVAKERRGDGVGFALMQELISTATARQLHMMVGGIDVSNRASVALHEKLGFAHAGTLKHAGFKFGHWLDLAFYQLLLDAPDVPVAG